MLTVVGGGVGVEDVPVGLVSTLLGTGSCPASGTAPDSSLGPDTKFVVLRSTSSIRTPSAPGMITRKKVLGGLFRFEESDL